MTSNWCVECLSLSPNVSCEICTQEICQYCVSQACWVIWSEHIVSIINLQQVTDDINDFGIDLENEELYFVCGDNCLDILIDNLQYNDIQFSEDGSQSDSESDTISIFSDEDIFHFELD